MKDVSAHMKSNGMDGAFYAVKSQEVDLLNNWSQMDMNEVTEWYKQKQWDNYFLNFIFTVLSLIITLYFTE